jgi:hypothetical protein
MNCGILNKASLMSKNFEKQSTNRQGIEFETLNDMDQGTIGAALGKRQHRRMMCWHSLGGLE